jgi:hypothetical protein
MVTVFIPYLLKKQNLFGGICGQEPDIPTDLRFHRTQNSGPLGPEVLYGFRISFSHQHLLISINRANFQKKSKIYFFIPVFGGLCNSLYYKDLEAPGKITAARSSPHGTSKKLRPVIKCAILTQVGYL